MCPAFSNDRYLTGAREQDRQRRQEEPGMQELHEETLHDPLISSHVIKQDELSTGIEHRRLVWVGPLTVLVSIGAVLLVRAAAVALIHPEPAFLPLSGAHVYRC
jgi:hypothetical protein